MQIGLSTTRSKFCLPMKPGDPALNSKLNSSLRESSSKDDKYVATIESQVGLGLVAVAKVLEKLIKEEKPPNDIKTQILPAQLNSTVRKIVKNSKLGKWLYGKDFAEKFKEATSHFRTGKERRLRGSAKKPNGSLDFRAMHHKGKMKEQQVDRKSYRLYKQRSLINLKEFAYEISADASGTGWGTVRGSNKSHGFWSADKAQKHINFLELLAVFYGLKCFCNEASGCHILLRVHNLTAIAYINKMGGIQIEDLNNQAGKYRNETEYALSNEGFYLFVADFGQPDIDIFATNINTKCKNYISWFRDPGAISTDAFTSNWSQFYGFYVFPPSSIMGRVLNKIIRDKDVGMVVVPFWPNQPWCSVFLRLSTSKPLILGPDKNLLLSSLTSRH
ncbi:hypothetical protein ILUMI_03447 [Ignelater luminosus]|uniref:Uncharacterized protein n=1 Tax=Ignelater luminosus TaxID=2038154 RepID=A0A8K0DBI9_IGNLU|nr:hypothetical protein ILUMI_03447 [Ignelater luminosus]